VAQTLARHGRTNVRPLVGGFDAWRRAGLPVEPKSTRKQSFAEVAENIRNAEGDDNDLV